MKYLSNHQLMSKLTEQNSLAKHDKEYLFYKISLEKPPNNHHYKKQQQEAQQKKENMISKFAWS